MQPNSIRALVEGSNKEGNFGSAIRRFESFLPSHCDKSLMG